MMKFISHWMITIIIAGFCLAPNNSAFAQTTIQDIEVIGAHRVDPGTVKSYLMLKSGDSMNRVALDNALKGLYATGLFADVSLEQVGRKLIVHVAENPIINRVAFEGNERVDDDELLAEIQLRPRHVFTRTKVQADVARLYQIYRRNGRFSADIEPKVIRLDQNRVDLVFEVQEGPVTKVKSIRFVGNEHFNDDYLRSEISTKEQAWYRFITVDDRYDPDRLAYDQELLRRFYLSQGYADFELISASAELSNEREHFFITFTVDEGNRYKFGNISINSNLTDFDSSVLNDTITLEQAKWYNADEIQKTVDRMTDKLGDLQYAFVNIRPESNRNAKERTIDISFTIDETPRVFVERININGNVRTLDKVIRRKLLLVEGDPFNRTKLARSEQRIRNLDYFDNVTVQANRGSAPDKTILDVSVEEKSTGELSIGAGFSTNDGPLADFRIRERNFLGKGQDLLFATTIAGERTEFNVSFTEPYFLNRDISAGVDVFHMTRDLQDESSYDQQRTGGALRMGYPLSERWRQTIRTRVERNEITDVDGSASRYITEQEGVRDTFALSQRLTYDNRNSTLFPTNGYTYWLDTEISGFGGDAKYISGRTGLSYYYPVFGKVVFNALGELGAIEGYGDEIVVINERFYMGGTNLRGFEQAGVGPRDISTDDSMGGNRFYRGSLELSFPLGLPEELGITGHAFTDAGSLFDLDVDESDSNIEDEDVLRASAGIGLSWRSPFGPLRVDLAKPYLSQDYDEEEVFRFNFGTRF